MATITSTSPSHPSSTLSAIETHNPLRNSVARPPLVTTSVSNMDPQAASPLHNYPDPISNDVQMSGNSNFFSAQRSQQQSLSQEDQNLANSLSHDMDAEMNVISPEITNGHAPNFGMGAQGALPQTPQQPPTGASMAGQHSGADPNQDLSYGIGTDRRKRSKVSRACDECRRKKVRCDSTTSDGTMIETCSNCRRLKLTCQFERAPMKRGPSKGYIKELAERVQNVESQIGMPIGYRPSVDAGSPSDPYPEQPYSPTEPLSSSRKRTFSQFDGRNPFTQSPRSSRDKLGSLSGYSINQGPQGGRGSFALAPDQQITDISPTAGVPPIDLAKPFWAQETEVERPIAKESTQSKAPAGDTWKGDSLFSAYVDIIHDDISILPRSFETVQSHVSKCPQELASAFTYVLVVACGSKSDHGLYASESDFEDYVWTSARVPPATRHISENVVWLWLYAFMVSNANADIARIRGTAKQLSKQTMLKMAIDLGQFLLAVAEQDEIEGTDDGFDSIQNIVRRTWSCINVLAQLHAVGTGSDEQTSSDPRNLALPAECKTLLSEPAASLAALSSILSLLSGHIQASVVSTPHSILPLKTRKFVESCVDVLLSTFPPTSASSSIIQEAQLFISLVLARHTFVNDPSEILDLALKLADTLYTDPVNPQGHEPPVARPLDIHLYTLTGLTLLELIDSEDVDLVKSSQDALGKIRHALEQISERAHARLQNILAGSQPEATHQLHWADALLRVIVAKGETDQGQRPSQTALEEACLPNEPPKEERESSTNESTNAKQEVQVISEEQKYLISRLTNVAAIQNTIRTSGTKMTVVDFSLLTRRGYLNVLADLNGF